MVSWFKDAGHTWLGKQRIFFFNLFLRVLNCQVFFFYILKTDDKKKKKKVRLVFVAAQKTFLTSQHLTKENARNTKSEDGSNWQGLVCGRRPAEAEETSLSSSI